MDYLEKAREAKERAEKHRESLTDFTEWLTIRGGRSVVHPDYRDTLSWDELPEPPPIRREQKR